MLPLRQVTTLSIIVNASGPLTLITEIAPVPGTVAGAQIVSSFRMYIVISVFSVLCPNCGMITQTHLACVLKAPTKLRIKPILTKLW